MIGDDTPTAENLQRLPFLQACVREAMRVNNPSTTNIPRISDVPVQLGKYIVPANTPILLNMYGVMHNEAHWSSTEEFNPDRFLDGVSLDQKGWIPFGLGPRQCPARAFSLTEQRTLLAMMLREYEWSLPVGSVHEERLKNSFSAFALNLPEDLDIIFKRRVQALT